MGVAVGDGGEDGLLEDGMVFSSHACGLWCGLLRRRG